jgi:membrane dipeptidase
MFATFVSGEGGNADTPDQAEAERGSQAMMEYLYELEAKAAGQLKVVTTAAQLATCLEEGALAAVIHFEGAEAIDPGLKNLLSLYEAGLRSLGVVWSRSNAFGHGVRFDFPHSPDTGPGLTDAGKALIRGCNELGILIDLSHMNERGFWDVARISEAPLVATHSCAHALSPSPRNLTDKQLDAIADHEGIVGINFHVGFLRADGQRNEDTPMAEIVRHTAYIADRIGVEHVGFGSDFDGATMPRELGDVTGLPRLVEALAARGFSEADLAKVTHENWQRVLAQTWRD